MRRLLLSLILVLAASAASAQTVLPGTPNYPNAVTPRGPKGDSGCSMLTTNGAPPATLGRDCDLAIDVAAGKVYGPKLAGQWGPGVVMSPVAAAQVYADRARFDAEKARAAAASIKTPPSRTISVSGAVLETDGTLYCDASGGPVTIDLPIATGSNRILTIKKIDASANSCALQRAGSDTIDGAATLVLTAKDQSVQVFDREAAAWAVASDAIGGALQLVNQSNGDIARYTLSLAGDNAPALQAAVNAAHGKRSVIKIPTGTWKFNSRVYRAITSQTSLCFEGAGRGSTALEFNGATATDGIVLEQLALGGYEFTACARNMDIVFNGALAGTVLRFTRPAGGISPGPQAVIENVAIYPKNISTDTAGNFVDISGMNYFYVDNLWTTGPYGPGVTMDFSDSSLYYRAATCLNVDSTYGGRVSNSKLSGCAVGISDVWMTAPAGEGITIENTNMVFNKTCFRWVRIAAEPSGWLHNNHCNYRDYGFYIDGAFAFKMEGNLIYNQGGVSTTNANGSRDYYLANVQDTDLLNSIHHYYGSTPIKTLGTITGGSGYVDGTYTNVPLTWASGLLANRYGTADITVSGGAVTAVTNTKGSAGFQITGTTYVTADNAFLGGSGSGFSVPVTEVGGVDNASPLRAAYEVAATYYDYDNRYLGSFAAPPTCASAAACRGKLYLDTVSNEMKVYNAGTWIPSRRVNRNVQVVHPRVDHNTGLNRLLEISHTGATNIVAVDPEVGSVNMLGSGAGYVTGAGKSVGRVERTTPLRTVIWKQTTPQTIPNLTFEPVTYNVEFKDEAGLFDAASSSTNIVIPDNSGIRRIKFEFSNTWTANATGVRRQFIYKNGALQSLCGANFDTVGSSLVSSVIRSNTCVLDTFDGDVWSDRVYQSSGGNLDLVAGQSTWLSAEVQ